MPDLVVLGWDSATFDVIDPLIERGRMPVLASLRERGFSAPLRSTWPPMTDCAWTSAFTGLNPGAHGIFGSWYRAPGAYECRYFSARDRRAPALWELAPEVSFVVSGVPMTYPPSPVEGAMVASYGAPPGSSFCEPAEIQGELAARWPLEDLMDRAPHGGLEEFLEDLLRTLRAQAEALVWLGDRTEAGCVVAVWPQIDRAQHFLWSFRDRGGALAGAVDRVYEAMDEATGRVLESAADADVMVVSDHGAGPLRGDVNLAAWLVGGGRAAYGRRGRPASGHRGRPVFGRPRWPSVAALAWALPPAARRLGRRLAPGLARRTLGASLSAQLGAFDWPRTQAFLGFHGDLWLNLEGREPQGCVSKEEAGPLLDELADEIVGLRDPASGSPLFAGAYRRAEIYAGPAAALGPDLMLDSWSAGYRVAPGRGPADELVRSPSPLSGVEVSWSSDHRPQGIFVAAGRRVRRGRAESLRLYDVCPTALALLERPLPEALDGRVATEALEPEWLAAHPVRSTSPRERRVEPDEYSDEEAAAVAAHLKELGYIE